MTYAPDEPDLAARLHADTELGPAWRCLRCGAFVLGEPDSAGPASGAPRVLRGRALREATVLRLFAVERFARAAGLLLLAWGVLRFRASETSWQAQFDRIVPAARPLARLFDLNLDTSPTVARLRELLHSAPSTLAWLAVALVGYALIEALEGVGLWSLQRWGEYVAAVATSVFLPFEVYELSHHVTWVRLVALGINVVLVVYLVVAKRLFGVRGGAAAADRERAGDSLLEVEASAAATARRTRSPRGRP